MQPLRPQLQSGTCSYSSQWCEYRTDVAEERSDVGWRHFSCHFKDSVLSNTALGAGFPDHFCYVCTYVPCCCGESLESPTLPKLVFIIFFSPLQVERAAVPKGQKAVSPNQSTALPSSPPRLHAAYNRPGPTCSR